MNPKEEKMMNVRKPVRRLLLVVLGIAALAGFDLAQTPTITQSESQLRLALRDAWDVHARWTRSYVVSSLAGLPDSARAKARLLEGANDVADAMKPYFFGTTMPALANVLKHNVLLTGRAVAAAQGGDSVAITTARSNWSAGTDSLVQFLARTNPNWPESKLGAPLQRYQDQTWRQILALTRQDWMADVAACDQAHIEALAIADLLTAGLVKQFPDRFK
jgi:hypothetical protein